MQAPADGEVEDEVVEVQNEAETMPLQAATSPQMQSAKAAEEHRSSGHIPFRDWCRFCIKGRGLENQHRPAAEDSSIPVVGLDYFFITAGDIKRKAELEYDKSAAGDETFQQDIRTGKLVKCDAPGRKSSLGTAFRTKAPARTSTSPTSSGKPWSGSATRASS